MVDQNDSITIRAGRRCDDRLNPPTSCQFATPNGSPKQASTVPSTAAATPTTNALADSFNGLYKTELVYHEGLWKGPDNR